MTTTGVTYNHKNGHFWQLDFTGKELDPETGYSYFGARYMDHILLSTFISVDCYAFKYPSVSPYAYCMLNPNIYKDPNGDTVILSKSAEKIHNLYYNINEEYTSLFNDLNRSPIFFIVNEYGDTPDINTRTEGGAVVKISSNENDEREAYKIEWGRAHPELGGDETHVFLEEMYHAGQILEYENNNGTIEREYDAKYFAIRVSTSPIDYTCEDRNGNSGVPTQLGVIHRESKKDACKFLKYGRKGVTIYRWGEVIHNAVIPGAYANFPDK